MSNAIYGGVINPPVPQPINSPYPRRLPDGCILALDTSVGVPGVARTNLIPADKVLFAGWTALNGEGVTLTQNQSLTYDGRTYTDATRIQGNGSGSITTKYIYNIGTSINGTPYSYSILVKNQGLSNISVGMNLPVSTSIIPAGTTALVSITNKIGDGSIVLSPRFLTANAGDILDIVCTQPMLSATPYVCAYDNSPSIPAIVPPKLLDRSGNGNHATITGAVPVMGLYGVYCNFDAVDDYINAGKPSHLNNLAQMSIEMWTYRKSQGEGNQGRYFDKGGIKSASCATSATRIDFRHAFSTTGGYWYSDTKIQLNKWQHIVITYDNTSVNNNPTMYIDGVPVAVTRNTQPVGNASSDNTHDWYFGNKADTNGAWDGGISQPRIYNRIMSAQEVLALYRQDAWRFGLRG